MLDSGKLAAGQMMSGGASSEASSAHAHLQPDLLVDAHAGSDVVVPLGFALTSADFIRLGPDLLLEAPDGTTLLVRGYFSIENAPSLLSAEGALIPGDLAMKLAGPSAPGEFAAGQGGQAQQAIGRADTISGQVTVIHADGTKGVLNKGDAVFQGDILQTVKGANVGLVFMDGTTLALGSAGRLVLDQMVYDAEAHTGKSAFSIVQGSFSFVSGQIAKSAPDAATIRTPVATIGIRGTMVAGSYSPETGLTTTLLPEGEGSGEFSITTAAGTSTSNVSYGAINVMNFFSAPSGVVIVSQGQVANSFQEVLNAISNTGNTNAAAKASADQILTQVFQDANAKNAGTVQDAFKGQTQTTTVDPKVADALQKAIIAAVTDGKPVAAALLAGMAAAEVYKQTLAQTGDEAKALQEAEKATAKLGVLDKADLTGDGKTGEGKPVDDPKNNQTEAPVTASPTQAPTEAPVTEAPTTSAPTITVEVTVAVTVAPEPTTEVTSPPVTDPPVTTSTTAHSGTAIDGYIQGGTVFLDANGNSQLDTGEIYVTTAPDGTYTINLTASTGTLVIKGGTDSDTGLDLTGVMKAPVGSSVITPLTSIVAAVMEANPTMTAAAAAGQVATMLGVADAAALLTYDPVANKGTAAELTDLNTAMTQVIALIQNAVPLLDNAGGDPLAAAANLFAALAQHGASPINLTDLDTIDDLITAAAASTPDVDSIEVSSNIDAVKNAVSSANANTYVLTHGTPNSLTAVGSGTVGTTYALTGAGESGDSFTDGNSNTNDVLKLDATANTLTVDNVSTIQLAYGGAGKAQELTLTNVDTIMGSAGNDIIKLVASAGSNTIYGGNGCDVVDYSGVAGNTTFYLGDDLIDGATGTDRFHDVETIIGGSGASDAIYSNSSVSVSATINLETGAGTADGHTYHFSGFEKALGGNLSDTLTGDSGNNYLSGLNGDDTIYGGAGDDSILGGDGNDLIVGGAGADDIDGGGGNDTLSYDGESNNFVINLVTGQTTAASIATETFANIENVIGGSGSDRITGSTGDNTLVAGAGDDSIDGGDGNDLIVGGLGNDIFAGGSGTDTLSYDGYSNGLTIDFLNSTVDDGSGADQISGFENAIGTASNDSFIGDSGNNSFTGGAGNDAVDYTADATGTTFNMFLGTVSGTGVGTDHLYTIETIIAGAAADTITAASGNAGATINLTSGQAKSVGYDYAVSGFENIVGSAYADTLTGDCGANIIEGGQGADELAGGGGNDVFVFTTSGDTDIKTIDDFSAGDAIHFTDAAYTIVADGDGGTVDAYGVEVYYDSGSGDTTLFFNTQDAPGTADFTIVLDGVSIEASNLSVIDGTLFYNSDPETYFTASASDNSITFAGGAQHASLTNAAMFSGADDFTVSMWVNATAAGKLYTQRGGDDHLGIGIDVGADGSLSFGLDKFTTGGWDVLYSDAGAVTLGEWSYLTFVKDGDTAYIYVNGKLVASDTIGAAQLSALVGNSGAYVAGDWDLGGFSGQLGELAVFSEALTSAEIVAAMVETPTTETTSSLEALYTMETGGIYADTSGNDRTMTPLGFPTSLSGTAGDDTFIVVSDGIFSGLAGNDTYSLDSLPGVANTIVIDDSAGTADTLKFNILEDYSVNHAIKGFSRDGDDLVIALAQDYTGASYDGGTIVISDEYAGTGKGVEYLTDGEGTPLHVATTNSGTTLMGTSLSDLMVGGETQTVLYGGAGQDMFYGVAGQTWIGGAGKDEASFWNVTAGVSVLLNESGNGTAVWDDGDPYTIWLQSIEELEGSQHNDILIGNSQSNWFAGHDGNDTIDGGQGQDTISYASHATTDNETGITVNLSGGAGAYGYYSVTHGAYVDKVRNIENIEGSDYDDTITGSINSDNWISGGKGNDILNGGTGDGIDYDTVAYDDDPNGVTVNLGSTQYVYNAVIYAATIAIDGWGNTDTVVNFEGVRGSDYDDLLIGGFGDTTFAPGKGSDIVIGRGSSDTVAYWDDSDPTDSDYPSQGISLVLDSSGTVMLTDPWDSGDTDTLINISNVQGTSRNDTLDGSSDSAANVLEGRGGNDALIGDASYNDMAAYYSAESGITANLSTNVVSDGLGGTDALTDIHKIAGSNYNDTLIIGSGNDTFWGGDGDDTVIVNDYAKLTAGDGLAGGDNNSADVSGQGDVLKLNDSSHSTVSLNFTTGAEVMGFEKIDLAQDVAYTLVLDDEMAYLADSDGYSASLDSTLKIAASVAITKKVVINASDFLSTSHVYVDATNFGGNNSFTGGAGADTYIGGVGSDVFFASLGYDSFAGGAGANKIYFNTVAGAITCNLDLGYASFTGGTLSYSGVHTILTGTGDDLITGSTASDEIFTADGDDTITLKGTLTAGDTVYGGLGTDEVNFDGDIDDYSFDFSSGLTLDVIAGGVTTHLEDVERLTFRDGSTLLLSEAGRIDVNDYTDGDQHYSALTKLSNGKFVAVWSSEGQASGSSDEQGAIYMQIFNADGSKYGGEEQVSTSTPAGTYGQSGNSVAAYTGGFAVVWSAMNASDEWSVYFRQFENDGDAAGSETLLVSSVINPNADVAALSDGAHFVVTWQEGTTLKASIVNASTGAVGSAIGIGTGEDMHVAALTTGINAGGFVATWESGGDVYFRMYDSDGIDYATAAMVNATTADNQIGSDVAVLGDGNIVITWQSGTGGNYDIYARVFDTSGTAVTGEILVNTSSTSGDQNLADVAALVGSSAVPNGFVVCWQNSDTGVVYAQMYQSSGATYGTQITVSDASLGTGSNPAITALAGGGFVVSWDGIDNSGSGVFSQVFDASGEAVGYATGTTSAGSVISADDNDNVIAAGGSVDVISGNAGNDTLSGAATIFGGTGNDTLVSGDGDGYLDGGTGNDTLISGDGDDYLDGGAGYNTVSYANADDCVTLDLAADGSTSSGGGGEDYITNVTAIIGSDYADEFTGDSDISETFYGGAGDDCLTAVGVANSLFGGEGSDTLQASGQNLLEGGADNDLFVVGNNVTIGDFAYGDTIQLSGTTLTTIGLGDGATIDPYGAVYESSWATGNTTIYFNSTDGVSSADKSIILEGLQLDNGASELSISGGKLVLNTNVIEVPSSTGDNGYVVDVIAGKSDRLYTESGTGQTIYLNGLAQSGDSVNDAASEASGSGDMLYLTAGSNTLSVSSIETVVLSSDAANTLELGYFGDLLLGGALADTITLTHGSNDGSATFVGGAGDDVYYLYSNDTGGSDTGDTISIAAGSGTDTIHAFSLHDSLKVGTPIFSITNGTGAAVGYGEVQVEWSANATTLHIGTDTTAGSDVDVVLVGTITDFGDDVYDTTGHYAAANFTANASGVITLTPSGMSNEGLTATSHGQLFAGSLINGVVETFSFSSGASFSSTLNLSGNAGVGDYVNMGGANDMVELTAAGSQVIGIEGVEEVMGAIDWGDDFVFTSVKGDSADGDVTVYLNDGENTLLVDANRVYLHDDSLAQGAIDFSVIGGSGNDTVTLLNSSASAPVTISMTTMTNVETLKLTGSQGVYLLAGDMIDLYTIIGSEGYDTIYNGSASSANWADIKDDEVSGIEYMNGVILYANQLGDVELLGNAEIRNSADNEIPTLSLEAGAEVAISGDDNFTAEELNIAANVMISLVEQARLVNLGTFNIDGAGVMIGLLSDDERFYNEGGTITLDAGADLTFVTESGASTVWLDGHISLGDSAYIAANSVRVEVGDALYVEGDYGTSISLDADSTFNAYGATLDLSGITNATLGETFSLVHAAQVGDITNGFSAFEGLDLGNGYYFNVTQTDQDIFATVALDSASTSGDDVYGFVGSEEIHATQAGDDYFRYASGTVSGATLLGGAGNDTLYISDTADLETLKSNMFDGGGGSGIDKIVFDASISDSVGVGTYGLSTVENPFSDKVTGVEELDFAAGTSGHFMLVSADDLFGLESDATLGGYTNVIIGGAEGNLVMFMDAVDDWTISSSITNAGYTVYEHLDGRGDTDLVVSVADGISAVSALGGAIGVF